jgi:aromatic amino acid aminotransferase I
LSLRSDIIIVEDDPYYFLQYDDYVPGVAARPCDNPQTYLDKLVPSYLKIDTQGRVIRLDTFSKVKMRRTATCRRSTR